MGAMVVALGDYHKEKNDKPPRQKEDKILAFSRQDHTPSGSGGGGGGGERKTN